MKDINKLATDFIKASLEHSGASVIASTLEQLAGFKEKEDFDLAVGQILIQSNRLEPEEIQELSQEVFTYVQSTPNALGYYVPGLLLLQMSGAELKTVLQLWNEDDVNSKFQAPNSK